MFGSAILEVAIGLAFLYLLMALGTSAIQEAIASFLNSRGKHLAQALSRMIDGNPTTTDNGDSNSTKVTATQLIQHPLIAALSKNGKPPRYIDSKYFSLVLLDLIQATDKEKMAEAREKINKLPDHLKQALLPLYDSANKDWQIFRMNIEDWYDSTMALTSAWYHQKAQLVMLAIALTLSIAINADTFHIATTLWKDDVLRQAIVISAEKQISAGQGDVVSTGIETTLKQVGFPIGWHQDKTGLPTSYNNQQDYLSLLTKFFGLFITALAASLGAPFWFDALNKLVNIRRGSQSKPDKTT